VNRVGLFFLVVTTRLVVPTILASGRFDAAPTPVYNRRQEFCSGVT